MANGVDRSDPSDLRALAAWYREYAIRAGNTVIWEARLRTAKDLEAEADRIERAQIEPARAAAIL